MKPILEKSKERLKKYNLAVIKQMASLATSGFSLVAALAWNNFIQTIINEYIKPAVGSSSVLISTGIYAIIVTLLAVFVTLQLSAMTEKLEQKKTA